MGTTVTIPSAIDELTPAWLTDALHASGVLPQHARVASVRAETLGEGSGFIGQLARLHLAYEGDASGAPPTVIAKMPALDEGARQLASMYGLYEREYRFYTELADEISFRTARCYYADGDAENTRYILLLEDMGQHGTAGDQVAGCSADEAHLALTELARHHAQWWRSPRLDEIAWIQPGIDLVAAAMEQAYPMSWEPTIAAFGDHIPPTIKDALPTLGARILELMEPYRDGPLTLAHGDYRLDNMFFGRDGAGYGLAVLDWQSPNKGWGLYDVSYFMYSNLDTDTRRACEDDVLRDYHAALVAQGVEGYSHDQVREDYVKSLLVSLAIWVVNAASLDMANERGRALFEIFFDRLVAAILDHDALRYLEA
jgi:hypothetical protein